MRIRLQRYPHKKEARTVVVLGAEISSEEALWRVLLLAGTKRNIVIGGIVERSAGEISSQETIWGVRGAEIVS